MTTGETKLITRTGRDVTAQYPDIHMIHELVDQVNAVLDGEIVAFDAEGRNSFEALQQRMNLANEREIKRIGEGDPRRAGGVRRAVAGRPRDDRTDAGGAARAAGADRGGRPSAPADDPRGGRREGVHGRGEGARARRRRGQAEGLEVPARQAFRHVAQDQAHEHAGLRDPGMDARAGRPLVDVRRVAGRRVRRRRVDVDRSGRLGLHREDARDRPGAAGSAGPRHARRSTTPTSRP